MVKFAWLVGADKAWVAKVVRPRRSRRISRVVRMFHVASALVPFWIFGWARGTIDKLVFVLCVGRFVELDGQQNKSVLDGREKM